MIGRKISHYQITDKIGEPWKWANLESHLLTEPPSIDAKPFFVTTFSKVTGGQK